MNADVVLAATCAALLVVAIIHTVYLTWRTRKNDRHLQNGVRSLENTVSFLQSLNELPLGLTAENLQLHILNKLQDILRPLGIDCRLWVVDNGWKTLKGIGRLEGTNGGPQHLPMGACPALQNHRVFSYQRSQKNPCPSESFLYGKHVCLPLVDGRESFGVLFLASAEATPWDSQQLHVFNVLAQAIALCFQRRIMFHKLQEKISELHFSFEVGASALTAFGGSTQSLEETTIQTLDAVLSVLKVDRTTFMTWNAETSTLTTEWVRGAGRTLETPLRLAEGKGMSGWALQSSQPYWAEYAMGDPHYVPSGSAICSLLCVPLFSPDHTPMGVINAMTLSRARTFSSREIEFVSNFGRLAALAMENAQLHQKSRHSISHLSEVSRLKSHFLSLVSHDLRGPLTGIRGFCEVLKQESVGPVNPVQRDMLEHLENQVQLQERMVDDLLDYARMEQGKMSISKKPTALGPLIQEEVQKAQHQARERGIVLTGPRDESLDLPLLPIDAGRVRQVLWNLIFNAMKFTPEGGDVHVTLTQTGEAALIEVTDSGIGLSSETQEKIFDSFFQITPGGSKGASGLGLGLAICREIVEAHGGTICSRSPGLGKGTTMSFTLPLRDADSQKQLAA